MPFFPRFNYPERSVAPLYPTDLFRVLDRLPDAFDSSSGQSPSRAFSPNFDVHETEHEYILEGELPGLDDKKKLSIEFTGKLPLIII